MNALCFMIKEKYVVLDVVNWPFRFIHNVLGFE